MVEGRGDQDEARAIHAFGFARLTALPVAVLYAFASPGTMGSLELVVLGAVALFDLVTSLLLMSDPPRIRPITVLPADIVAVTAIMAISGGADSHVRYLAVTLLVAIALYFRPRQVVAATVVAGLAVILVALPDLVRSEADAPVQVLEILAALAWAGFTYVGLVSARLEIGERVTTAAEERRALLRTVLDNEERERRRITADLHEGPLQRMLALRQDLEEAGAGDAEAMAYAADGVVLAIAELREVIAGLHPVALDHGGLRAGLQALADRAGADAGMQVKVSVSDEAQGVRDELVVTVSRELIANVAAHAHATRLEVQVAVEHGELTLSVGDDGVGFEPDGQALVQSIGLAAVRERVDSAGGVLDVWSQPHKGTRVSARLPASRRAGD